jgi:hypothetical protein
MPCIFCIAVLAMVGGTIATAALDKIQDSLAKKSGNPVARTSDTESATKLETTFNVGGQQVPVAVTLYRLHARARIQVLTHALSAPQVERLQDEIAAAIDGRIVDRSDVTGIGLLKDPTPRGGDVKAKDRVPKPNPPESLPPRG